MNPKNQYRTELIHGFCLMCILGIALFGSWFVMLNTTVGEKKEVWATTYVVDSMRNQNIQVDSALVVCLNSTDSLKRELLKMDENFHDNVDLMINKANGWLAFWLGVIAIALGLLAMWQIFRQIKVEEKMKELNNNFKNAIEEQKKRIDQSIEKCEDLCEKMEMEKAQMLCTIKENRIAASMICISIPDPLIASSPNDRRLMLKSQLLKILKDYDEYLTIARSQTKWDSYENVPSILINIKIAFMRARPAFSSYDKQVTFHEFVLEVNSAIKEFQKLGVFIGEDDIKLLINISAKMRELIMKIGEN